MMIVYSQYTGGLPLQYRWRNCCGKDWKRRFADVPKQDIRKFLALFAGAFAFAPKQKLKFSPDDKILVIYQALYPIKAMPDALELETLATDLAQAYGVLLQDIWHDDLSLGELFESTLNHITATD
ncbi:hypothetical protein JYB87_10090 [Shewanella avicenniae]|uniref:DUF3208 domain-containing protein n=1 Tax=Shewanella avicenniae TaxID=2814294 RepID=A0ABX7QN46_9GAMM|nr:hypothetical protein [Shewanella avicenniae]QSX32136.1 hypothetical protein JYB87_10090 [Shewanella avicenniae]